MLEIMKAERDGLLCLSGCRNKINKDEYFVQETHYRGTTRLCVRCFKELNTKLNMPFIIKEK